MAESVLLELQRTIDARMERLLHELERRIHAWIEKEGEIIDTRLRGMDQALILRTTELETHLARLNHAHEQQVADRHDLVTKQYHDQSVASVRLALELFQRDLTMWRDSAQTTLVELKLKVGALEAVLAQQSERRWNIIVSALGSSALMSAIVGGIIAWATRVPK